MQARWIPGLCALLVAFASPQAQEPRVDFTESEKPESEHQEVQNGLEEWRSLHGDSWRLLMRKETGFGRLLHGGSTLPLFHPESDLDFARLALRALAQTRSIHGVDPASLALDHLMLLPLGIAGSTDKMTARFRQQVGGVPVMEGWVNVLMDMQGGILSIDSTGLPDLAGFDVRPSLDAAAALSVGLETFQLETGLPPLRWEAPRLMIEQAGEGKRHRPRLVWQVEVHFDQPDSEPVGWRYLLDAHIGRVVGRVPAFHHQSVSGTVQSRATPGTLPDTAGNPETNQGMPHLRVTSSQGNAITDASGDFTISGASPPVNVTVEYYGDWCNSNNNAGSDYSLSTTLSSSSGNLVQMNPSSQALVTAEANAFLWINNLRDWTRSINPSDSTMDFRAVSNANLSSTCNAYYNGVSVNFYQSGGGCVNTSYSTVVVHEMGHWANDLYGSGNGSDGFGEGNADVYAMYITDQPIVGEDFCGTGCHIRTGLNTRPFCGDSNPGCYGGVHADGEPLMGALWKVRARLKTTLGASAGSATADVLHNSWMNAYNQTQIKSIIEIQWLTLDDDDGNIDNGTPNYADIDGGFTDQGFPGYPLPFMSFSNVTHLADTPDEIGPYTVDADIVAQMYPPLVAPTMMYRVNGGAFVPVAMSPVSGDTYTADIPGQTAPAEVEYYLTADDNNGNTGHYPTGAPGTTLNFFVGIRTVFFSDDFESGVNGWTHGTYNGTQDDWQRSADVGLTGSAAKSGDPANAYSATNIWGNDLGPSSWNGAYQSGIDNFLRSPVLDLSDAVGTILTFQRWLTVEQGQYDQARVRVNGTEVWVNPLATDLLDTSWVEVEIDISAIADGNSSVQIEFGLETDSSVVFGGWNIDDVEVFSMQGGCTAATASKPDDLVRCPGESATFGTTAGGTPPFTYQWKKDGAAIGGATSSSYTIGSVTLADAGDYTVVVTNACGSAESLPGALTVNDTVTATDPDDETVCQGSSASFSTTAGGTPPFTYQWRKDGADIGGATASSHTIASATPADAGAYTVFVTGACGSVETGPGILTVNAATTATDPADRTACPGDSVAFSTTAGGTPPFTYQWKKDGADIGGATASSYAIASATPADAGAYTVVVGGACGSVEAGPGVLTVDDPVTASDPGDESVCEGDSASFSTTAGGTPPHTWQWRKDGADIGGATASSYAIASTTPADAGAYTVLVTGACGSVETGPGILTVNAATTATDPDDETVCPGDSVTFSTTAGGTPPFTYQWRKDGADITGATASSYYIASAVLADAGAYTVFVTGDCGSVETAPGILTVTETVTATDPGDETACPGDLVTFGTTASGTPPFTYQWKKDGADIGGATASSYTIAAVTPADAGAYTVFVTGACGSVETGPGILTVNAATTATDPDDQTVCEGSPASFSTTAGGTPPFTYQWRKDGADIGGATASSYTIASAVLADAGAYTVLVTGDCGSVETAPGILTVNAATTATDPGDETACPGDLVTFSTTASGTPPFTYQWRKDGADIGGATASSYTIASVTPVDAGAYTVFVTGACGSVETDPGILTVNEEATATDPDDQTVCEGSPASFSTTAGGAPPFTYQWRKDGGDIGGATASSYTIAAVTPADAGAYTVFVTGACGSVETGPGILTVNAATTATDPDDQTVCEGSPASFSTTAGGTPPFTYQWRKDGADIGGATASSYTIAATTPADAGAYTVFVTGACGSVETAPGILTVNDTVSATDPDDQTACPGDLVTFNTTASGGGPYTYQWRKDGADIGGATASSYTIASVTPADAGAYTVFVTGGCGSVETGPGVLTVGDPVTATDPDDQSVCEGSPASFSTTAGGGAPYTYQWRKDGADITGATASSYTIASATPADAGAYTVFVTGACGSVETGPGILTVNAATTATDPADETACEGDSVAFSTTAGGTAPFTWQWRKDGADITGATGSSYTIASVVPADAGAYTVFVSGACGSVETGPGILTVNEAVTATDPLDQTVCQGDLVVLSTTAGGTPPFTYQWRKDGADITGATASSYTILKAAPGDAGAYTVFVTGGCGSVETGPGILTVNGKTTATDPDDLTVCPGGSAIFSTVAGGTPPFTYQWKKDGADITGATASSYTIASVTPGDAGAYTVFVTGACSSLETGPGVLSVGGVAVIYCTAKMNSQGCTPAIGASGIASMSDPTPFLITATQVINNKNGLLFYGLTGRNNLPFQGGILCVQPPTKRTFVQISGGNPPPNDCSGSYSMDFNAWSQGGSDPNLGVGVQVNGQYWSRDPHSPSTTGLTDAVEFIICD